MGVARLQPGLETTIEKGSTTMATPVPIDFAGASGRVYHYPFLASLAADQIKKEAGNYVFVKRLANGNAVPVYFGQADNLSARLSTHDRWAEAAKLGATQVYAHTTQGGEAARLAEEKDLIQRWKPALNTQHKQAL
jgi:hypothetical protein